MKAAFCIILFLVCCSEAIVSEVERQSLVDLYNATGGDSWDDNDNWLVGDPCEDSWFGIRCDRATNSKIDTIRLGRNNLVGTIPTLNLPTLRAL